jgi:hypothetical protein
VLEQEERQRKESAAQKLEGSKMEIPAPSENIAKAAQPFVEALAEAVQIEILKKGTEPASVAGKNIVTLEEGFAARDTYTTQASVITRQLGLAGIAVIWVFKVGEGPGYSVPGELVPPALMLVLGITLDLLHYVAGAILWQLYTKAAQSKGTKEFDAPPWINNVTWGLFTVKIIAVISAYFYLITYLTGKILN